MAFSKEKAHDKAERYAAKGQHDKAAREYQSIVDHDPKDIRAWLMLADCLVRSGDPPGALSRYLQVANYYAEHRDFQKALAVYRQALNIDPSRADVHFRCAKINLELGRVHDAVANLEHLAQLQLQSGKVNDAIETYRQIADTDPTIVSKRLRLAELYSREKRKAEAVEAFQRAGDVLLETNRKADYVRVAERLLWHDNRHRSTIRKLSRVYLELGDPRRALMKLNALLQADQQDLEGLELLAETFIALGKPDKAHSVLVELARGATDRDRGRVVAALRKGVQWLPDDAELAALLHQYVPEAAQPEIQEDEDEDEEVLELDESDAEVLELDEDDVIMEEGSAEAELPAAESAAPITSSVMSEVANEGAPTAGLSAAESEDLDKILFEARVYVKYRLFDHALEHIRGVLERAPQHVGAMALQARALGELGRAQEAAEAHIGVARLVADRDPRLAQEHLDAAHEQVPGHPAVAALLGELESGPPAAAPAMDSVEVDLADPGDSSALELTDDEEDFAIEISDTEQQVTERGRPPVENRFGLSDAGPLPERDRGQYADVLEDEETGVLQVPDRDLDTHALSVDEEPSHAIRESTSSEVLDDQFDVAPEDFADVSLADAEGPGTGQAQEAPEASEGDALDDILADLDNDLGIEAAEPPAQPATPAVEEPAQAGVPRQVHPDISEDLAEVRFFLDQGLDEDAEAALVDLKEKAPGHPEIAKLEAELAGVQAPGASVEESGAVPLLDLVSEEDAEADAYLSSIFSDDAPAQSAAPKKKVGVKAKAQDVAGANARDHFDLGMAYREMGLVDEAVSQFQSAAADPAWRSRALVMTGVLRGHRGETDAAIADFSAAIEAATTDDERCEARYELAVLYEKVGNAQAAIEHFTAVDAGYRDRDERLGGLQG